MSRHDSAQIEILHLLLLLMLQELVLMLVMPAASGRCQHRLLVFVLGLPLKRLSQLPGYGLFDDEVMGGLISAAKGGLK